MRNFQTPLDSAKIHFTLHTEHFKFEKGGNMLEKDQAVLAEVREINTEIRKDAGEIRENSCGRELLKEHLSDFSTTGMLFAEVTADMMAETEDLFTLSGCCDR